MTLTTKDLRVETLESVAREAAEIILSNDLALLHSRFGYALAFDRDPVLALRQDIEDSLREVGATAFTEPGHFEVDVAYYPEAQAAPFAVIECSLPTDGSRPVLMELVVVLKDEIGHVTLEQFSGAT